MRAGSGGVSGFRPARRAAVSQALARRRSGLALGDAGPERVDVGALAERADALQLELEGRGRGRRQLGVEVAGDVLADLAEEAQRDVQGLQRAPARALHARLAPRRGAWPMSSGIGRAAKSRIMALPRPGASNAPRSLAQILTRP